jgi:hypothetical protein
MPSRAEAGAARANKAAAAATAISEMRVIGFLPAALLRLADTISRSSDCSRDATLFMK